MNTQNGNEWLTIGTMKCGILLGVCGVVLAFLLIFLGFWGTLMVVAFFAVGYWLGACPGKSAAIKSTINKLFPPKGE